LTVENIGLCEKTEAPTLTDGDGVPRRASLRRPDASSKKKSMTFFNLSTSKDPKFTRSRCTGAPGGGAAGRGAAREQSRV